jgi:two-component system OmpR family sensor kinase
VQRLRSTLREDGQTRSAEEIEVGLKRLVRLIERLLQMSRAQSGLGRNPIVTDINPVIALLLRELRDRVPSQDKLVVTPPTGTWPSHVDPDALGIILSNLFENALKYANADTPIRADASVPGRIVIENDCDPLSPADLEVIKRRFIRKAKISDGYGLGLSIVQALCAQSGCTLDVHSPPEGQARGFAAILTVPTA